MITQQSFGVEIGQETLPVINLTWVITKVRLYKLVKPNMAWSIFCIKFNHVLCWPENLLVHVPKIWSHDIFNDYMISIQKHILLINFLSITISTRLWWAKSCPWWPLPWQFPCTWTTDNSRTICSWTDSKRRNYSRCWSCNATINYISWCIAGRAEAASPCFYALWRASSSSWSTSVTSCSQSAAGISAKSSAAEAAAAATTLSAHASFAYAASKHATATASIPFTPALSSPSTSPSSNASSWHAFSNPIFNARIFAFINAWSNGMI